MVCLSKPVPSAWASVVPPALPIQMTDNGPHQTAGGPAAAWSRLLPRGYLLLEWLQKGPNLRWGISHHGFLWLQDVTPNHGWETCLLHKAGFFPAASVLLEWWQRRPPPSWRILCCSFLAPHKTGSQWEKDTEISKPKKICVKKL